MEKSITTSAKIPEKIHIQMLERIVREGYGLRGKSKWINEAISKFLEFSNYPELVDIAQDIEKIRVPVSFRIDNEVSNKLEDSVVIVRKSYPAMEGVKSNIIRASIMQRLIRG